MQHSFDIIVLGAGIAGTLCARYLADGGRRVALVDRRPIDRAGPRWFAGIPKEVLNEWRLAPMADEVLGWGENLVLTSFSGRHRVRLTRHSLWELDAPRWGTRLRLEAREAGVAVFAECLVKSVLLDGTRVLGVETEKGILRAGLVIDASGLAAIGRRAVFPDWPEVPAHHICQATQQTHRIKDKKGAREYLEHNQVRDGDTFVRSSLSGGYSILQVRVDLDAGLAYLLAGSIPDRPGILPGKVLVDRLLGSETWLGEMVRGGSGPIPLRRPYARLVAPGLALLGDSACMVYSPNASGVAVGIRAARLLVDAVLSASPARSGDEEVLWRYARAFHIRYGGLLAGFDLVRRLTQRFSGDENDALFDCGFLGESVTRAGLAQALPVPSLGETLRLRKALLYPQITARALATFARVPLFLANARTYPRRPDLDALRRFEARTAAIFGDSPDPVA